MTDYNPQNFFILAVDDNSLNRILLKKVLQNEGYQCEILADSEEVIPWLEKYIHHPDLILLDLIMPKINGLELCQRLKFHCDFQEIPIIFVTASEQKTDVLKAFDVGAVDYIVKPFHVPEVLARIKTHIELKFIRDELTLTLKKLEKLALTDELTNIYNRRHFMQLAQREFKLAKRQKRFFSVLIVDIDNFKQVNDSYGHLAGDNVITLIAQDCVKSLRQEDLCARWGGEEFIIFLSETSLPEAVAVGNRLRKQIEKKIISFESHQLNLTISIGVSSYHSEDRELNQIISRADMALYHGKKTGKNKVVDEETIM